MSHLPSLMALRCFDASARLGSFTRAAGEVHLTQGAVSHQVLGLEAQLGVALFLRRRTGLTLTAPGRSYWLEVAAALRQIERATQNMVTHKGQGGAFNLCCASSFASYWLVPRLSGFVAAHPEVTLNLSTHIGPVDFSTSRHDAAIEFCDGPAPGLLAVKVHSLVLRPYAAPALLKGHGRRGAAQLADAGFEPDQFTPFSGARGPHHAGGEEAHLLVEFDLGGHPEHRSDQAADLLREATAGSSAISSQAVLISVSRLATS